MTFYETQIQKVTNAPAEIVPILEDIMREDIFHSTLGWQSPEQFDRGARQAYEVYQADQEFFKLQAEMRKVASAQFRAELHHKELTEQGAPETEIAEAKAKLETVNHQYSKMLEKLNQ